MSRSRLSLGSVLALAATMAALPPADASAAVRKMMSMCPQSKMCAWLHADVTPPKGWVEDKDYGQRNKVTMLVLDKPELAVEDPMIYVQTGLRAKPQTLDENIKANQDIWRKSEPTVRIIALGTVARAGGKEPFKLFLYENPTRPQQAFEKIAFTFDTQPNGDVYVFTIVDTAASRKAIDDSNGAFQAVLSGL
jgi:hypothetical protein